MLLAYFMEQVSKLRNVIKKYYKCEVKGSEISLQVSKQQNPTQQCFDFIKCFHHELILQNTKLCVCTSSTKELSTYFLIQSFQDMTEGNQ
jgi:O-phosphoseryl-tRNA(Cys) synthetase